MIDNVWFTAGKQNAENSVELGLIQPVMQAADSPDVSSVHVQRQQATEVSLSHHDDVTDDVIDDVCQLPSLCAEFKAQLCTECEEVSAALV